MAISGLKARLRRHKGLLSFLCKSYNKLNIHNSVKGKVSVSGVVLLKGVKIYDCGKNNEISIGDLSRLSNVTIYVSGNNNSIIIGENCHLNHTEICIEDSENQLEIGSGTAVSGQTKLCVIEGTRLTVGQNCLFADSILIRTGDSHSILDLHGKRINRSKDITIGNHCWIGTGVTILKGVNIQNDSVVGAGALVSGKSFEANSIIAGNPAKEVKQNITWDGRRFLH